MKIGKCSKCERKKVYIEKDGKCIECLKDEGDPEASAILRIDICELEYDTVRRCIEKAKNRKGFIRIQHRKPNELTGTPDCDLDIYIDQVAFYGRPLEGTGYDFEDYEGKTKEEKLVKALIDAYQDISTKLF